MPDETANQRYRAEYRRDEIPSWYSGIGHACFTFGVGSAAVLYCLSQVRSAVATDWLVIPLTFLYANLSEYLGHRFPMHHPWPGLGLLFHRHVGQHHRFFTDEHMEFESTRDFKVVLFPAILASFFIGAFALPAGWVVGQLWSHNAAMLFIATGIAYFLNYEALHFAYHVPASHPIARLPGIALLRRLHWRHHDTRRMTHVNFNITYPICDVLFGTYER